MKFNKRYYNSNKQDKDRVGLFFYKNLIKNYFKPRTVLDYGCGTGHLLKRLAKIKTIQKTYGYEINEYAIKAAKENSKSSTIISDLNLVKNNSIDLITSLHVIEHLNDQQLDKILKSFQRILRNDGSLIFATPAKDGLAHLIKKDKWIGFSDKTHINLKNYEEWMNYFQSKNLQLIKSSSDGLWNFPYATINIKLLVQVFILMIFQILTGKLFLKHTKGETFIFLLKFNSD